MPERAITLSAQHRAATDGSITRIAKGTVDVGPLLGEFIANGGRTVVVHEHPTAYGEGYKVYFLPTEGIVADSIARMASVLQVHPSRLRTQASQLTTQKESGSTADGSTADSRERVSRRQPGTSEELAAAARSRLVKATRPWHKADAFDALLKVLEQTHLPVDKTTRNQTKQGRSIIFGAGSRKRCSQSLLASATLEQPDLFALVLHALQCAIEDQPELQGFKFTSIYVSEGILTRLLVASMFPFPNCALNAKAASG